MFVPLDTLMIGNQLINNAFVSIGRLSPGSGLVYTIIHLKNKNVGRGELDTENGGQ